MKLDVIFAHQLLREDAAKGSWCVAIDVLRATSTIIVALANGAAEVCPCLSAAEAKHCAGSMPKGMCLLGGEEMGCPVPGFDLGNSPLEYLAPQSIGGKTVFLATTNGTTAIRRAYASSGIPVCIGALLNMSAVSLAVVKAAVAGGVAGVIFVCAGQDGSPAAEDIFCAGLMVRQVEGELHQVGIVPGLGDGASIAAGFAAANEGRAPEVLATSEHGRYLQSIGCGQDVEFASRFDAYGIVPVFDGRRIVSLQGAPLLCRQG